MQRSFQSTDKCFRYYERTMQGMWVELSLFKMLKMDGSESGVIERGETPGLLPLQSLVYPRPLYPRLPSHLQTALRVFQTRVSGTCVHPDTFPFPIPILNQSIAPHLVSLILFFTLFIPNRWMRDPQLVLDPWVCLNLSKAPSAQRCREVR